MYFHEKNLKAICKINKSGYLAIVQVTQVHAEEHEFLLLISRHVLPTQPCPWLLAAPFSDFAWMIRGYEFSEDLFFSKGYLKRALHMGKFRNCRSARETAVGCRRESVNGEEAPCDVVVWKTEFHLSFILFSNSGITFTASSITGLPPLLTFSRTINTS